MDGGRSQPGVMRHVRQSNVPAKWGPGERIDISFTPQRYLRGVSIRGDDGPAHTSPAYCFLQPAHRLTWIRISSTS